MCGIAGIFNINGTKISESDLKSMTDKIGHRGPDGEGVFVDDNLGLGHRRLAILDTSALGSQPMFSKNGEWGVVFNGCIYNYQEIKNELKSKGHSFISTTD